jgi:hypothetical protein
MGRGALLDVIVAIALVAGCSPVSTVTNSPTPTVAPSPTPTQSASRTAAPTPPRASRASWASATANASDVIARFRSAGLNVETQPPSSYVIFGADRVDLFLVGGETAAIYTFPTTAASARIYDEAANFRLTVSYLRTPYYVQVANLLVVITTNDPKAAAAMIDAIMRAT